MDFIKNASFICASGEEVVNAPLFKSEFRLDDKKIKSAILQISSLGIYKACINNYKIGEALLTPGWTNYHKRLQYQTYDITDFIRVKNEISVVVAKGWFYGRISYGRYNSLGKKKPSLVAAIKIVYDDDTEKYIYTDESWHVQNSNFIMSDIWDGEIYDSRPIESQIYQCECVDYPIENLIEQEGPFVKKYEAIKAQKLIITPNGETVIDFGQEISGYIDFYVQGNSGDEVILQHAEVLDKDGNFYVENLRSAKQCIKFICNGEPTNYHATFSYQCFRYIKVCAYPGEIKLENFKAVVIHSQMERTGSFKCSNNKVNKLFENVIWGQRCNFIDIPSDCPQRDERLGWTGDAQAFIKTAAYNFNVKQFFQKWLRDMKSEQLDNGAVPRTIPAVWSENDGVSAGWGDAALICPWNLYLMYGDISILEESFEVMTGWVEYIRNQGENEFLWNTGKQYGDWLGLDNEPGSYCGSTDKSLIATAFYAYSVSLLIKVGKILNKDISKYEKLHIEILRAFRETYVFGNRLLSDTQTAYVLAISFDLVEDKSAMANRLAELVSEAGNKLKTGFIGTPYLLQSLSNNGYKDLAFSLLLQEEYPSWLFSVNMGATTIWEHWDSIKEDGTMWSPDMNSFNHYAYGSVASWLYHDVAGIQPDENCTGFKHFYLRPITDKRLKYIEASFNTDYGKILSSWRYENKKIIYNFTVPKGTTATIEIHNIKETVAEGNYSYYINN